MAVLPTIHAAAQNLTSWQEASLVPQGRTIRRDADLWSVQLPAPGIWFSAITLNPTARVPDGDPEDPATVVCDSFSMLVPPPAGLRRDGEGRWFARAGGRPVPDAPVPGASVRPLRSPAELAEVVRVVATAFGLRPPLDTAEVHPPTLLDDPSMCVLGAFVSDELVGTAMACDDGAMLGLYGVGVTETHRRRGLATALTASALGWRPALPAVLQPTPGAAALYERLGFVEIGRFGVLRPDPGPFRAGPAPVRGDDR